MRSVTRLALLSAATLLASLIALRGTASSDVLAAAAGASSPRPALPGTVGAADDPDGSPIEGRRIYMRENCYGCHGGFAGGGMCPSLRHSRPNDDDVREVVRNGTPNGMPRFPELTEVDIQNLCAYFQSLRTPREPTFTHWWEPVPTQ